MKTRTYTILTTLLTLLGVAGLLSLRLVGFYSHQALAIMLLLGFAWAVGSRVRLLWKGRLHPRRLSGFGQREFRPQLLQAVGPCELLGGGLGRVPGGVPPARPR